MNQKTLLRKNQLAENKPNTYIWQRTYLESLKSLTDQEEKDNPNKKKQKPENLTNGMIQINLKKWSKADIKHERKLMKQLNCYEITLEYSLAVQ